MKWLKRLFNRKKNEVAQTEQLNIPVVIKRCPHCNEEVNYLNHKKHLYMNCIDNDNVL